jgi:hypothetical protein
LAIEWDSLYAVACITNDTRNERVKNLTAKIIYQQLTRNQMIIAGEQSFEAL